TTDLGCAYDGSVGIAVARSPPDAHGAARGVWRGRAGAVGDRHLRRAGVRRHRARPGIRHPPRAWRRSRRDPFARAQTGATDGWNRNLGRPARLARADEISPVAALRRDDA